MCQETVDGCLCPKISLIDPETGASIQATVRGLVRSNPQSDMSEQNTSPQGYAFGQKVQCRCTPSPDKSFPYNLPPNFYILPKPHVEPCQSQEDPKCKDKAVAHCEFTPQGQSALWKGSLCMKHASAAIFKTCDLEGKKEIARRQIMARAGLKW